MIIGFLRSYLAGIPAIADKLSAPKSGVRIFRRVVPKGTPLPYVRLAQIGGNPDYHLNGEIGDLSVRVQCDVWTETENEADEISELIRLAPLSGFHGQWTDDQQRTVQVKAVTIKNEPETFEDPKDGSDGMRYRNTKDYQIHFERAVN